MPAATAYALNGHGDLPYLRIPGPTAAWNVRARALITQVVADAGVAQARDGALFIATSCQDGGAAEHAQCDMDFHALSRRIGDWLDWCGPVFLVSSACTSSMQALLSAAEWLRAGHATQALVLGLELDNQLTLPGFAALQLLSSGGSKPFALRRDGLVLGEAVAALRLSTEQVAPWQLRGGANVVDGTQPTSASVSAVVQMYQRALAASGLSTLDVDLIKVQAAGSPGNDAVEAQGIRAAFAGVPALVSLKPLIGHCMGASGAAEIALLLECIERDYWPRYSDAVDPALRVQLATQAPRQLRYVLAAILGFGGIHTAAVLERSPS
ncbi:beta-ketoacyl synthase N-terminal-like domain-containing protein [Rhodoferax saidenbachensis]|uniref:3-oxoacyl-[acyl-carrier-protein] synthase-1 n=1 Tax=Rhodoferax saidenbachensis TaxID=1484693 RepID=A0ABU1ZMA0_9BURK|nr:beta-ketoacyl synthase N-terminal-like domain-containing protein [Rhodoferax saidenbachensis]MDR7306086.1 3-oxoacyl-[acyl-carrier-protein] synthase-1 [Rhodoferax saidenbachensis]